MPRKTKARSWLRALWCRRCRGSGFIESRLARLKRLLKECSWLLMCRRLKSRLGKKNKRPIGTTEVVP